MAGENMRNQKGSIILETLFACILLVIVFAGMTEIALITRDQIGVIRTAREGAREAALSGNISSGYSRAREVAQLSLPGMPSITLTTEPANANTENVVCQVSYEHKPFLNQLGIGGMTLSAEACYHFKDFNE